jgi:preprotein translocase subunit SecA
MLDDLKQRVTSMLSRVELAPDRPMAEVVPPPQTYRLTESRPEAQSGLLTASFDGGATLVDDRAETGVVATLPARTPAVDPKNEATWAATPRNAQCPCGSGKKYKHCHGRLA